MPNKAKETLQSRKFLVTMAVILLAAAGKATNQISDEDALNMIRWAAGVYVGALSIEDAAKALAPSLARLLSGDE